MLIVVSYGDFVIHFGVVISTENGGMLLVVLVSSNRNQNRDGHVEAVALAQSGMMMSLKKSHRLFSHPNEGTTKALGIKITQGQLPVCQDYSIAMTEQKSY